MNSREQRPPAPFRAPASTTPVADPTGAILQIVGDQWFDFGRVSAATVQRRVERRMRQQSITSASDYVALLQRSSDEAGTLRADLLAGGSTFFGDHRAWDFIEQHVVPRVIAHARSARPVRAWLPYCGAGADAYALAMLLLEHVRAVGSEVVVQVFASDVDERLLDVARTGRFPSIAAATLGTERLDRFFVASRGGYQVKHDLRRVIVFARHDLFNDIPFSHLDLICCRSLFTHLRPSARESAAHLLHRSLDEGGYLILGLGDSIDGTSRLFEAASRRWSVYHRTAGVWGAARGTERPTPGWTVTRPPEPMPPGPETSDGRASRERDHADLARLQRVVTMGRLAATLAHELSQPLTAMANLLAACASHLRGGPSSQEQLLDLIGQATSQSDRAGRIITHITRLLHDGNRRVQPCELRTLATTAAELVRPTLRQQGIDLQLALGATPLRAEVCRVEVEQVLVNLLQNAADAAIGNDHAPRWIRVEIAPAPAGYATIAVADSGSGIPDGMEQRIFEPFFTTKPEGFGMGLAICRSIVALHGGRVWAERHIATNATRVCFTVPLAESARLSSAGA